MRHRQSNGGAGRPDQPEEARSESQGAVLTKGATLQCMALIGTSACRGVQTGYATLKGGQPYERSRSRRATRSGIGLHPFLEQRFHLIVELLIVAVVNFGRSHAPVGGLIAPVIRPRSSFGATR